MSEVSKPSSPVRASTLRRMKKKKTPISMVTAYDATFARLFDQAGIDVLLVGDSLGMVVQGRDGTLEVTLEDVIYHTRAVVRGTTRAHVVADMPFMSYQIDPGEALRNAGRLMKEGHAHSVKLEGGAEYGPTVAKIVGAGIPVMGHVGLLPQSVHAMGGYRVQGRTASEARSILEDARALAEAGAYAVVLEGVPAELASRVTQDLEIPSIGIGAGPGCDGQVLVGYDLLGLNTGHRPKFVRAFAELGMATIDAARSYVQSVKEGSFPSEEHAYSAKERLFGPRALEDEGDEEAPPYGAAS
ncbi:MAG: 3-methyl-2-oxobutanoate hydroxymethyltransferase [Myxococcota bacterium]